MILSRQPRAISASLNIAKPLFRKERYIFFIVYILAIKYIHAHADTHAPNAHSHVGLSVNLFVYLTVLFQYKSLGPALERICLPLTGWFYLFHFCLRIKLQISRSDSATVENQRPRYISIISQLCICHCLRVRTYIHVYDCKNGFVIPCRCVFIKRM